MFRVKSADDGENWASISDMMSGLMIVFLFVSIVYMLNVSKSQENIKELVVTYQAAQVALYDDLHNEFNKDLEKWMATIDKDTLSIEFFEPDILFQQGQAAVTLKFKEILNDFFPRYLKIIYSDKFKDVISEVRIEGHTSSEWTNDTTDSDEAYFNNMKLSQARTLSVLYYCYGIIKDEVIKELMKRNITANGLSSSRLILDGTGKEDKIRSRRVAFRTVTNSEKRIIQILGEFTK